MFSKIISVSNQKGGVGKTTTAVTIATELALKNYKTLLIDCDPQSNSTSSFEINKLPNQTIYEVLVNQESINNSICSTSIDKLYLAPSNQNLSAAEIELVDITNREMLLKKAINEVEKDYDYIIIDTPPALGILTINCLTACKWVLIPLQVEYFALEGLNNLMQTIEMIKDKPVTEKELIDFCKETLAKFKVPKKIEFCELPKTSTGKIQKFELRKKAEELS